MLRVDPSERADISDVVNYCEKQLTVLNKKVESHEEESVNKKKGARMDPVLIMDDIIEKLNLLGYLSKFCQSRGVKPISRTYFAVRNENEPTE